VLRPRLRQRGAGVCKEVEVPAYEAMQDRAGMGARMQEILLHGVSTRHYQTVFPAMAETAGVSKSNGSRETIEASEAALEELLGRRFEGQEILIIYLDASTSASNASWARWAWIVPGANRYWACARARPRTRRRFARINPVLQMKVRDYFVQGRRGWVRLHEKGGKEHGPLSPQSGAAPRRIHRGGRVRRGLGRAFVPDGRRQDRLTHRCPCSSRKPTG
jgi:hypothetical protein